MLADFQNALARLVADTNFRASFFRSGEESLAGFSLSARERRSLLSISQKELNRFAASLVAKRAEEFYRALPLTLKICPSIDRRYRRWLELNPVPRIDTCLDPGRAETLRALPALQKEIAGDPGEALYAADLFVFETLAGCSSQDGQPRFMRTRYRVDLLAAEIRRGIIPIDPECVPTVFRFEKKNLSWRSLDPKEQLS